MPMPPGSNTDTSGTALTRSQFNSQNTNTFGPTTFGVSTASDQDNTENFGSGGGQAGTNPGTYYPLSAIGTTTYTSAMQTSGPPFSAIPSFAGWEVSIENA